MSDESTPLRLRPPANPVSPRAKTMWRLTSLATLLLALVAIGVWAWFDPERRAWQIGLAVATMFLDGAHLTIMPEVRYRTHRWEADEIAVHSQTGWLNKERRIAPISRVQTVDTRYGALERLFGLGTVTVTTASAAGAVKIAGLERDTVEELAARLTAVTAATEGDAT